MKKVVSVSLGSSKRNKQSTLELNGEQFLVERLGTDGDFNLFAQTFQDLDGKVDALGIGGADLYVVVGQKRYTFRQINNVFKKVKTTPVVDGSGLKHTLEREGIFWIQKNGILDFEKEKVLLVSGVDRYGMAQALGKLNAKVTYGDLLFGLGLPFPLRSEHQLSMVAKTLLPIITQLPLQWIYPTGEKQEKRTPKYSQYFDEATVIAGDWHFIRRFAPNKLENKTVITQTLRSQDLEWLKEIGVKQVLTTTPIIGGETFATNVMEGVLVSLINKPVQEITEKDYYEWIKKLEWKPNIISFKE